MAKNEPKEPAKKELRRETFELGAWDKNILGSMAATLNMLKQAADEINANITAYLSKKASEEWDFPEDGYTVFKEFSLETGKVTVVQYEETNDPKDNSDAPSGSSKSAADAKAKPASEEDEKAPGQEEA